jgi:predicted metal-dependent RNase
MRKNSLEHGCEKIICMHGDRCTELAQLISQEYGVETESPANGDEIVI